MSNRIGFFIVCALNLVILILVGLYIYRNRLQVQSSSKISIAELFFQYSLEDMKLSPGIILSPLSGERITLDSLVGAEDTFFVLWINARSCPPCTEEALTTFQAFTIKNGLNKRIILASFYNPRDLFIMLKEKGIDTPVFVPEAMPKAIFEVYNNISQPLIFVLDSDFCIKSAFIPIKGERIRSDAYFQAIAGRYFKSGHN